MVLLLSQDTGWICVDIVLLRCGAVLVLCGGVWCDVRACGDGVMYERVVRV